MSIYAIQMYYQEVERIIHFGGTTKETSIRVAFQNLLNDYARQKDLMLVPEVSLKTASGSTIFPDGTLKDMLRQDWGHWESKDQDDDLDKEIENKFSKGYPKDNILFEDSKTAVLIQAGQEVQRVKMENKEALDHLLHCFVNFQRPEVQHFHEAIEHFKEDIPKVTLRLRELLIEQAKTNKTYVKARTKFLKLCQKSINPEVNAEDVREMIIQHILTEDIFNTIFDETQFHRENNIARELEGVIHTFFTGKVKRTVLAGITHYYKALKAAAAGIADHHEKQKFLKVVYETFYKSYNPKAADRLGVVYTPNEIVKFMIEGTDYLLHTHFNKYLEDKNVHILDPATGTGTFICDIIDYIRKDKLAYKYKNELHSNEVAILPYYISNLNIEITYQQKMGEYEEFTQHCFVDTLDNTGALSQAKQGDLFSQLSEENSARIRHQNSREISVVIGNPPYNANQMNENDNNKNRVYPEIDQRIKDTFIYHSTAQKTKVYDMYSRFYRWAMDRLDDNGIIAFVTNRSFIESRTFDGFRKCIQEEFSDAYIIDTKSDVRANPKIAGTSHNVFGIQAGVAILFLIKQPRKPKTKKVPCHIRYVALEDEWLKEKKLTWLNENPLRSISFEHIRPDKDNNWLNLADNDWDSLLPICSKEVKAGKGKKAIFELFSSGIVTARDEWVYDFSKENLKHKVLYFIDKYNDFIDKNNLSWKPTIKWSASLKTHFKKQIKLFFNEKLIIKANYRPFSNCFYYPEKILSDRLTQNHYDTFSKSLIKQNKLIGFLSGARLNFCVISTNLVPNFSIFSLDPAKWVSLYRYDSAGNRQENITDWGLNQFTKHYRTKKIKKEDIFHYIYAVLHNPAYREKYEINLKRDYPRIPFYADFFQWRDWGKSLMDLHIEYETVEHYPLTETTTDIENPKAKLKANKDNGIIILDEATQLSGIPAQAWEYKLGNRSALEWVLDQYKEKKPRDPTIREKFNHYRFADYKTEVITLLKQVCTVSVETLKITDMMRDTES